MSVPMPGSGFAPQLHLSIPSTTTSFKRSFEQFGFDLDDSPIRTNGGPDPSNQSNNGLGGSGLHGPHAFHHHQGYGGSSLAGMAGTNTAASSRRPNDRNKRARSASSGTASSAGSTSRSSEASSSFSTRGSQSSSSSTALDNRRHRIATAARSPRSSLEHPRRLPTPDVDVDMPDVEGDVRFNLTLRHSSPSSPRSNASASSGQRGPSALSDPSSPILPGAARVHSPSHSNSPIASGNTLNFPQAYRLALQGYTDAASPTSPPTLPPLLLESHEELVFSLSNEERQNWEGIAQESRNRGVATRDAHAVNGDDPPRIHLDLPHPSLIPLTGSEDGEQNEQDSSQSNSEGSSPLEPSVDALTFYSHLHPPTLPPIPSAGLFIDDNDDPDVATTPSAPPQSLADHVPPSPSLHELRQWIYDAASPSADSDSSISGLARSDVADQGTSRVILETPSSPRLDARREEYRFPAAGSRPTPSVPSHLHGPSLQRLQESWQDFTSRMLQDDSRSEGSLDRNGNDDRSADVGRAEGGGGDDTGMRISNELAFLDGLYDYGPSSSAGRGEGSRSASPVPGPSTSSGVALGADEGSPSSRARRQGEGVSALALACDELFGGTSFEHGRVSPTLPPLASASSLLSSGRDLTLSMLNASASNQNAASGSTNQDSTSRVTRSPFSRRLRRRLALFDDDDDDMEGDQEDDIVAAPTSRAGPRFSAISTTATAGSPTSSTTSATQQRASIINRRRPRTFMPLELDLGSRHESSAEDLTRPLASPGERFPLFGRPLVNRESPADSSSSDESEPVAASNPYSGPFTFSSSARLSLAGASSSASSRDGNVTGNPSSAPRYHRPRHVSFRSSSSSLVAESDSEIRSRDLTRLLALGPSSMSTTSSATSSGQQRQGPETHMMQFTPSSSVDSQNGMEAQSGAGRGGQQHTMWLLGPGVNQDRGWMRSQDGSSMDGTSGSSTEDIASLDQGNMMVVDDRSVPATPTAATSASTTTLPTSRLPTRLPPVPTRDTGATSDTPVYLRDRYGNPVRYSSSMLREQTARNSNSNGSPSDTIRDSRTAAPPSQPPLPRYMFEYDFVTSSSENSSANSPIIDSGPTGTSTAASEAAPRTTGFLPEPSLPSPYLNLPDLSSFEHLMGAIDSNIRRADRMGDDVAEIPSGVPPPPSEDNRASSPGLSDFFAVTESWVGDFVGTHDFVMGPRRQMGGSGVGARSGGGSTDTAETQRQQRQQQAEQQHQPIVRPPHRSLSLRSVTGREGNESASRRTTTFGRAVDYWPNLEMDTSEMPSYQSPLFGAGPPSSSAQPSATQSTPSVPSRPSVNPAPPPYSARYNSTPSMINSERTTNPPEDGDLASRFIPGPYRNTMRMLELERSAGERLLREQQERQLLQRYYTQPTRPPSPPPLLPAPQPPTASRARTSAWSLSNRWGELYESPANANPPPPLPSGPGSRPPRPSSLVQYLSTRHGLRQSELPLPGRSDSQVGGEGGINSQATDGSTTAAPPSVSQPRRPLSLDVEFSALERRMYERHARARPPRVPSPSAPSSSSSGMANNQSLGYFASGGRYPLPAGAASPSTSTPLGARRFAISEQMRPFNQAIESLRDPASGAPPPVHMTAADLLRRTRDLEEGGVEGNGRLGAPRGGRIRHRGFGDFRRRMGLNLGDFMRDEDFDQSYEGLLTLGAIVGEVKPRSTPSEVLDSMKKAEYKDWANTESDKRCPICLDDYAPTDQVMKLNHCPHWLHRDCLQQWLQGASTCPVCRHKVHGSPTPSLRVAPSPPSASTAQRLRSLSNMSRRLSRRLDSNSTEGSTNSNPSPTSSSFRYVPPDVPRARRDRDDDDSTGNGPPANPMSNVETLYRFPPFSPS